jgi:hypothetical protein
MTNLVSKFEYYSSLKGLVVTQFDTDVDASQHIPREEGLIVLVRQKDIS